MRTKKHNRKKPLCEAENKPGREAVQVAAREVSGAKRNHTDQADTKTAKRLALGRYTNKKLHTRYAVKKKYIYL